MRCVHPFARQPVGSAFASRSHQIVMNHAMTLCIISCWTAGDWRVEFENQLSTFIATVEHFNFKLIATELAWTYSSKWKESGRKMHLKWLSSVFITIETEFLGNCIGKMYFDCISLRFIAFHCILSHFAAHFCISLALSLKVGQTKSRRHHLDQVINGAIHLNWMMHSISTHQQSTRRCQNVKNCVSNSRNWQLRRQFWVYRTSVDSNRSFK